MSFMAKGVKCLELETKTQRFSFCCRITIRCWMTSATKSANIEAVEATKWRGVEQATIYKFNEYKHTCNSFHFSFILFLWVSRSCHIVGVAVAFDLYANCLFVWYWLLFTLNMELIHCSYIATLFIVNDRETRVANAEYDLWIAFANFVFSAKYRPHELIYLFFFSH